jgi:hypothetical protein
MAISEEERGGASVGEHGRASVDQRGGASVGEHAGASVGEHGRASVDERGGASVDVFSEAEALVDRFGGRAPGSDSERRAAGYLEARLRELGRSAEVETIDTWPAWPLAYAIHTTVAVVASVLSVSSPLLGAALALAASLLTFLDASVMLPTTRRLLGRRASQNVVSWDERDAPGALVLVAHCDSGPRGLAPSDRWEQRRATFGKLVRRPIGPFEPLFYSLVAVLACCLVRLPGLSGTVITTIQFIPTVALIVAVPLLLDLARSPAEAGENDNASGVALVLRLAERFGAQPFEHFGLHVLFSGSQKALADGMHAFLKRHKKDLSRERIVFLNLDEVGTGTVRFTTREGSLLATRSHPQLTQLCTELAEDDDEAGAEPLVNRVPSDGYAARSAGFPAITITCRNALDWAPRRLDERALDRAEDFCAELVRRFDAELGPDVVAPAEDIALSESGP